MQSAVPSRHPKYRTKLCRNFASGDCPFGEQCSFIHPTPRISPSSSALAQRLFNWNPLLLPQLLALSKLQGGQKEMSQRSPPLPKGPQLVDEDQSPATSLLLSKSDSTSPEQVPQTRKSRKRRKYPCRHFVRTGGWCPAGEQCGFYHDGTALPSERIQKAEHAPPFATEGPGKEGRTISGGFLMGIQSPSPPTVSQARSEPPQYTEAQLVQPYQPMYWPNHTWRPYQPYRTPAPTVAAVPILITEAPSVVRHGVYPPPQLQAQTVHPSETQAHLPLGSYEVNGTTYFPTSIASVSAPPLVPYSLPTRSVPYSHVMARVYPYHASPTWPAAYYDIPDRTTEVGPRTIFDPFASDPMMPSDLPVIPRLEDYQISPIQRDVLPLPPSSLLAPSDHLDPATPTRKPTVTQAHEVEFPYRPLKDQCVGHARRISVTIKKHGRVNSG